jgi:hypothetical protein
MFFKSLYLSQITLETPSALHLFLYFLKEKHREEQPRNPRLAILQAAISCNDHGGVAQRPTEALFPRDNFGASRAIIALIIYAQPHLLPLSFTRDYFNRAAPATTK